MAFIQFPLYGSRLQKNNLAKCKRDPSGYYGHKVYKWKACAVKPSPFLEDDDQPVHKDEIPVEEVEGYLENAKVRPKIDIDADEYMLMWKLRKMLHEDDFNRIFDQKSRRIGEI